MTDELKLGMVRIGADNTSSWTLEAYHEATAKTPAYWRPIKYLNTLESAISTFFEYEARKRVSQGVGFLEAFEEAKAVVLASSCAVEYRDMENEVVRIKAREIRDPNKKEPASVG